MELDTVCCWAKQRPLKKKKLKFFIAFEFIKKRATDSLFNMFNTLWLIWYH
jgi:hypothetical protein